MIGAKVNGVMYGASTVGITTENKIAPPSSLTISTYPNPIQQQAVIQIHGSTENSNLEITIEDVLGRTMKRMIKNLMRSNSISCDVSSFPAGTYFIRVMNGGNVAVGKMVVGR